MINKNKLKIDINYDEQRKADILYNDSRFQSKGFYTTRCLEVNYFNVSNNEH